MGATREGAPPRPAGVRSPESTREAMDRAAMHARNSMSELIFATQAVLDAASIAATGNPSDASAALAPIRRGLDDLATRLGQTSGALPASMLRAVLDALDVEIARWEEQSTKDTDARAVLRTFLGLREILWEFGFRREPDGAAARAGPKRKAARASRAGRASETSDPGAPTKGPRVQRVDVKG